MKNRIKWIVGVAALAAAPLSLMAAPTANAGVGGCATAAVSNVPLQEAPTFFVGCSVGAVNNCRSWHNPLGKPADQAVVTTVNLVTCSTL